MSDHDALLRQAADAGFVPLERTSEWEVGELPESYPWAV
jgi:hypothetical protein